MSTSPTESADRASFLHSLPVFPSVALELIDMLERADSDATAIVHLLGRDPALSAEVLHRANSARFARRRAVTDLSDAVTLLGTDQTSRIAMNAAFRGLVAPALGRPELRRCWEHSLATAIVADSLAPQFDQAPRSAYTAGLLHDIGSLALLAVYPDRYLEALTFARREGIARHEAERRIFGVDHCAAGRWVVDEWRLPEGLREVILHHYDKRPFDRSMLTLIATAAALADLIQPYPILALPWSGPEEYLATLPIDQKPALEAVESAARRVKAELAA